MAKMSDSILDEILGKRSGGVDGSDLNDARNDADSTDEPAPDEDPLVVAADELLQAIRRGDPKALADALRNALVLADSDAPGDSPERDYCGGVTGRRR